MKPILPKTVMSGNGLPQVCNVLAPPGTTIILPPTRMQGDVVEGYQGIHLPSSNSPFASQQVMQPSPVILPLTPTKPSYGSNILPKLNGVGQQVSSRTKADLLKIALPKGKRNKQIAKKTSVKSFFYIPVLNTTAPTFISNVPALPPSSSSSSGSTVALKPKSAKKCKVILQKNVSGGSSCSSLGIIEKEERKDIGGDSKCSTSGNQKRPTNKVRNRVSKCGKKSKYAGACKSVPDSVKIIAKSKMNAACGKRTLVTAGEASRGLTEKVNENDYLPNQRIPHHPPPPYPHLQGIKTDTTNKVPFTESSTEKVPYSVECASKDNLLVPQNLHSDKSKNIYTPPQYTLFDSGNSVSCNASSSYSLCDPSVPSESFTSKEAYTNNPSSILPNHMGGVSQQDMTAGTLQQLEDSTVPCSYSRTPESSLSPYRSRSFTSDFTRSVTPSIDPPSYSSSPHPMKYSSAATATHLSSTYEENYSSSIYSNSLPTNHSPTASPQCAASTSTGVLDASHIELPSSSHVGLSSEIRKQSANEDLGPPISPSLPVLCDTVNPQNSNQLFNGCSSYVSRTASSYPLSPNAVQTSYPLHMSHQASPQQVSMNHNSYAPSPQTIAYSNACSPQSGAYSTLPHPSIYNASPQACSYTQSPQSNFYSPSPSSSSYPNSFQQVHYPQGVTHSSPMQHSVMRNSSQSPQTVRHNFSGNQEYAESPHQIDYCQSPDNTPLIGRNISNDFVKDLHPSSLLPPYSFPLLSSSHFNDGSDNTCSESHGHHSNIIEGTQHMDSSKSSCMTPHSYSIDRCSLSGMPGDRSLSPPSYEAHFRNTMSFPVTSHTPSSAVSDRDNSQHQQQQQSTPQNYSLDHHMSRYQEHGISDLQLDHKACMGAPPAYSAISASSLSGLPPHYASGSESHDVNYPFTPDICNDSQEYSPLENTGNFFSNTPHVLPIPADENLVSVSSTCSSQGLSASHSAALMNDMYLPHGCNGEELGHRTSKGSDSHSQHHSNVTPSVQENWRNGSGENIKVHDLIERAEKLWFIPHQEQNKIYMHRKEEAKGILNHSVSKSNRDSLMKEKFWIEEDEPISAEIINSSMKNTLSKDRLSQGDTNRTTNEEKNIPVSRVPKGKKNKEMLCQFCGKFLKGRNSLKSHLNIHLNNQAHSCPYCSKSFSTRSVLVQHLRIHTGEKPYTCPICDTAFRTRSSLMRHKSMHSDERPFECSMCSKAFKTKLVLQQHLKLHLTGLFTCPLCDRTFEKHKAYVVHKASHHINKKKFRCTHCSKGYRFRSLLNHHMQMHANIRKHVCPICSEAFVWRSGLAAHMKTHSNSLPKCDICGARFRSEKRLEGHRRRHSNKKPHSCNDCGHSFAYAYRLASHRLVHQQRKEFKCLKCSIVFNSEAKLKKHTVDHMEDVSTVCQSSESKT